MTQIIEIAAAFTVGVIAARLYWSGMIAKAKTLTSELEKKL